MIKRLSELAEFLEATCDYEVAATVKRKDKTLDDSYGVREIEVDYAGLRIVISLRDRTTPDTKEGNYLYSASFNSFKDEESWYSVLNTSCAVTVGANKWEYRLLKALNDALTENIELIAVDSKKLQQGLKLKEIVEGITEGFPTKKVKVIEVSDVDLHCVKVETETVCGNDFTVTYYYREERVRLTADQQRKTIAVPGGLPTLHRYLTPLMEADEKMHQILIGE